MERSNTRTSTRTYVHASSTYLSIQSTQYSTPPNNPPYFFTPTRPYVFTLTHLLTPTRFVFSATGAVLSPEVAELTGHWQLFVETLVRGYQCASYLVQENIETDRGRLACSHRPEMDKVTNFIRHGDGRFLLLKLAKVSHLYRNVNQTAERVRNGDIVLDLSSMEKVSTANTLPSYTLDTPSI